MSLTAESVKKCLTEICGAIAELQTVAAPVVNFTVSAGNSPTDISGGVATINNGSSLHLFSLGSLGFTVTQGSAIVQVEPKFITETPTVAGAPAAPPVDTTVPWLHFAQDGQYYWSPSTSVWVLVPGGGGGDNWGTQAVVSDATLTGDGTAGSPLSAVGGGGGGTTEVADQITITGIGTIADPFVGVAAAPSIDSCNGIRLGTDLKLYSEDQFYRVARTIAELEAVIAGGNDALVCSPLTMTADVSFLSNRTIKFVGAGSIDTAGFGLKLDLGIRNPNNRQIFFNYVIDEGYPARYNDTATTVKGSFNGDNVRNPKWWGLVSYRTVGESNGASVAQNGINVDAIYAAAMSFSFNQAPGHNILVRCPGGAVPFNRPIRLNDTKAVLEGASLGFAGTQFYAHPQFDTSFFILSEDYPLNGSTPMFQIGWEIQPAPAINPGAGFQTGARNVSFIGPSTTPGRRISGVMWEHGLQEGTVLSYINIQGFGGYGIGGPRAQGTAHNVVPAPGTSYLQLNTVRFDNLWIFGVTELDAVCMSVFGINGNIDTVTVDHGREAGGMVPPASGSTNGVTAAILAGGRECMNWTNIHIEQGLGQNEVGAGIYCPTTGSTAERIKFDSAFYLASRPLPGVSPYTNTEGATIKFNNNRGGFVAENIGMGQGWNYGGPSSYVAIHDVPRAKKSTGYHAGPGGGTWVASYARQMTAGVYEVSTSDPALV